MTQIKRTGKVVFHDASLSIWEEGLGGSWEEREAWSKAFKHQVFKRIIQTLNRIGWKCVIPQDYIDQYSRSFAENHRYCIKGDLKADLSISGRLIELKMFQNINAPDRPDHEGRYQNDKEKHMPYLLKLEMNRTRIRIRNYLCNVFSEYEFSTKRNNGRINKRGVNHLTAMEWIEGCYETSWHFKGDTTSYQITKVNSRSANSDFVEHGQRVWFADSKGRMCTGIAFYNINNMWWVITGKYDVRNMASFDLYTTPPNDIRKKRNAKLREGKLKSLMDEAAKSMAFERAALFRDLLQQNMEKA